MTAASETRRADATRNDERIIRAALVTLGQDPTAGMDAIAAGAGVGRTTLHRRYNTRDELLSRLRDLAVEELRDAVRESRLQEGPADDALDRLIDASVAHLSEFAFLASSTATPGYFRDRAIVRQIAALIRRGQEEGTFSTAAPPEWWVDVLPALITVAFRSPRGTRKADAADLIRATLRGGLAV